MNDDIYENDGLDIRAFDRSFCYFSLSLHSHIALVFCQFFLFFLLVLIVTKIAIIIRVAKTIKLIIK